MSDTSTTKMWNWNNFEIILSMVVDIEIRVAEYFAETLMFENRYQEKVFFGYPLFVVAIYNFDLHFALDLETKFGKIEQS